MKNRKRELLIILALIIGAALFRGGLLLIPNQSDGQLLVNAASLTVQHGQVTVTMSNRIYHPNALAVTVGTTVTWINHDPMDHTVTEGQGASATPHGFTSGLIAQGKSWSYVFKTPGTYLYTCLLHADMNGQIIVKKAT
jgi:plastocyanin